MNKPKSRHDRLPPRKLRRPDRIHREENEMSSVHGIAAVVLMLCGIEFARIAKVLYKEAQNTMGPDCQ
jgi:hypothetical protein